MDGLPRDGYLVVRRAVRDSLTQLAPEERAARYERDLLMLTVPELWSGESQPAGSGD